MKKLFEEAGITGFRSGNREYGLEYYASLVTHSTLAEAHNTGAAVRYAANGVQYNMPEESNGSTAATSANRCGTRSSGSGTRD